MWMIALSLVAPVEPLEWVQVCVEGTWKGHPQRPEGFTLTRRDFDEIVANFAADPRKRIVVDYEHQTMLARENGRPAPASGWITALEARQVGEASELWAKVEWTRAADTAIRAKEYSYLSPVLVFGSKDRVTGKPVGTRLLNVALTNSPFFQELSAIAASDLLPETSMLLLLATMLALPPETAKEEDVVDKVKKLKGEREAACRALGLDATATPEQVATRFSDLARFARVGELACTELKLAASLTPEQAAAAALPALQHAGYVSASDHAVVVAELATLKSGGLLEQARRDGKIVPATETWFSDFAKRDPAGATAWLACAPKVATSASDRRATKAGPSTQLTEEELAVCTQLQLSPEEFLKSREVN